jgi:predicted naringenin-chalcone synthase
MADGTSYNDAAIPQRREGEGRMSFSICGLATAVPETVLGEVDAMLLARRVCCSTVEQAMALPKVYRQCGIKQRHVVLDKQVCRDVLDGTRLSKSVFLPESVVDKQGPTTAERLEHYALCAGPLVQDAARQALECSGVSPRRITHIVTVSCTGFHAPGLDIELIKGLGLRPTTERTHVGFMGCHGVLNGLRVARGFTTSDANARVLVCAVELCSLHYHYGWDAEQVVVNALFGDGAGALVGAQRGPAGSWNLAASGSCVFPDSASDMIWRIGDRGFRMTLSKRVPDLIGANLRPWLLEWLGGNGLRLDDVESWAIHPGGPKILTAVQEALNLKPEAIQPALDVLSNHGNMSSATILFLIQLLQERRSPRPCVALGFGPGLAVEAALFR